MPYWLKSVSVWIYFSKLNLPVRNPVLFPSIYKYEKTFACTCNFGSKLYMSEWGHRGGVGIGGGEDGWSEASVRREATAEGGTTQEVGLHGDDVGPRITARLRTHRREGTMGKHRHGKPPSHTSCYTNVLIILLIIVAASMAETFRLSAPSFFPMLMQS